MKSDLLTDAIEGVVVLKIVEFVRRVRAYSDDRMEDHADLVRMQDYTVFAAEPVTADSEVWIVWHPGSRERDDDESSRRSEDVLERMEDEMWRRGFTCHISVPYAIAQCAWWREHAEESEAVLREYANYLAIEMNTAKYAPRQAVELSPAVAG